MACKRTARAFQARGAAGGSDLKNTAFHAALLLGFSDRGVGAGHVIVFNEVGGGAFRGQALPSAALDMGHQPQRNEYPYSKARV